MKNAPKFRVNTLLKIALGLIIVLVLAFVGISAYLGHSMTRSERLPVQGNPGELGIAYEDVSFPSLDEDIILKGWFLPAEDSDRVIVMVHGNGGNRADASIGMLDIASGLVADGYNVLTFDLRGCGESGGDMVSGGYYEKNDVEGAVNYVKDLGFERIGVMGFSLGVVSSILAAAEDTDIDVLVSDSSFADLADIMGPEFAARTKAPSALLRPILFMVKLMYGVDFTNIKPVEHIEDIAPRPVLFIHGEADEMMKVDHAQRLYEASDNPDNELWLVPGAEHTRAYKTAPEEYMERVTAFFNGALK